MRKFSAELAALESENLRRRRVTDCARGARIRVDGREYLFCSNAYLGLAADPRVVAALPQLYLYDSQPPGRWPEHS